MEPPAGLVIVYFIVYTGIIEFAVSTFVFCYDTFSQLRV